MHAILYLGVGVHGVLYAYRARCGIRRKALMQIKKRLFKSVEPDQRCVRCNGAKEIKGGA